MDLDQWERPSSLYSPIASSIRERARAGQDPRASTTAEAAAAQVMAVVMAAVVGGGGGWLARAAAALGLGGRAPAWFLAGGQAAYFFLVGLLQRTVGWPTVPILEKRFGLQKLAAQQAAAMHS